jgi:glutathionylspermidine synthase
MNSPFTAGAPLQANDWRLIRLRAMFDCCKWDIQSEDHCVLADFPLFLEQDAWQLVAQMAEKLAHEALLAEKELLARPDLHSKLGLPRRIHKLFQSSNGSNPSNGVARVHRFDFHFTSEGWRISEVNSDVPGGFIEASGFAEIIAEHFPGYSPPANPACLYAEAIARATGERGLVGFVHATAHSDDRQVMEYLARGLRSRGMATVMLSPEHLRWESDIARVAGKFAAGEPAVLVRFFPGEWLCELRPDSIWTPWFVGSATPLSNPGSALLVQSKRFPLTWPELRSPLDAWRELLPATKCPSDVRDFSQGDWVLKPIFGRVGEDVAIAGVTEHRSFDAILRAARKHPDEWVAQRRFETAPLETERGPRYACLGIFTVDGRAAGAYGRVATKPLIDQEAQDAAVLVRR